VDGNIYMDPVEGTKHESTIIFFHDQYQNNEEIYNIFSKELIGGQEMKTLASLNTRIVIPQAPSIKITALKDYVPNYGPAWFDFNTLYYDQESPIG
jgi:hypothetical protein